MHYPMADDADGADARIISRRDKAILGRIDRIKIAGTLRKETRTSTRDRLPNSAGEPADNGPQAGSNRALAGIAVSGRYVRFASIASGILLRCTKN